MTLHETDLLFTVEPTTEVTRHDRRSTLEIPPRGEEAQLVAIAGPDRGKRFVFTGEVTIGRNPSAEVYLQDQCISGKHASIAPNARGGFVLRDLGSRNGTTVNGKAITEVEIAFGDKIVLGESTVLTFTYSDPMEEQLLQVQKLEAVGRLAAGVAHEFNNLLAVVIANLNVLEDMSQLEPQEVAACVEEARRAATRGAELTRHMLDYSRMGGEHHRQMNLSHLVNELVQVQSRLFGPTIALKADVTDDLGVVGNRNQLSQVLMNICLNARDAIELGAGASIRIRGRRVKIERIGSEPAAGLVPGEYVLLVVEDDGCGMPKDVAARAFEPFFSTKEPGKGTGLGLSVAHGVVHSHGGQIVIDSQPGVGTKISLYFPWVEICSREDSQRVRKPVPKRSRYSGTVLVVDDDALVARSLGRMLERLGARVILTGSGEDGLLEFTKSRGEIDAVLLDVVMPGIGGEGTLQRLRAMDPKVAVVVSSGYTEADIARRMLALGASAFLKKPYDLEELESAIAMHLQSSVLDDES